MTGGLEITFGILAKSKNDASVNVLLAGLDSPHQAIQDSSLRALLARRSPTGERKLLERWRDLSTHCRQIIHEHPGRMTTAMRNAVLSDDPQRCKIACEALLELREFDLTPALLNAAEAESNPLGDLAAKTLHSLCELLYKEIAAPRNYQDRRDPQLVRRHVVASLELSIDRYKTHKRREIIESFLMLVNRDNSKLKQILQHPHDPAYLMIVDVLTHSPTPGVMRLVLGWLDDPHAPPSALKVIARRIDEPFIHHLLRRVGYEPSSTAGANLRRIESFAWVQEAPELLDRLDDACQHAAIQLLMASGMKRFDVFPIIDRVLEFGKVGGRRASALALAEFKGTDANRLLIRALRDSDPEVQANVLVQLRQKGFPGAMATLIALLDSRHEIVRHEARNSLSEFTFRRYLTSFDMLDDEVKASTGRLVKKVDLSTVGELVNEMEAPARSRRLRALEIAVCIGCVSELEESIIDLLADEDHFVRAEAASALRCCDTKSTRNALREKLLDNSLVVQEAAEQSLQALAGGVVDDQALLTDDKLPAVMQMLGETKTNEGTS